ncbi:MAG: hypothetical protein EOO12_05875 [Chitinophagaceae bacterium]|nr:MAG: hypothetical protein EOO12_05875 [Chitinophagaceae bacterium]
MLENIPSYASLLAARVADGSESTDLYGQVAAELEKGSGHADKSRASFIRDQCAGFDGKAIFQKYAGRWGIPAFRDGLVSLADFRRGFLYRFRDHSNDWPDAAAARDWFLQSPEAKTARRYEYWSKERGFAECVQVVEGSYEELVRALKAQGADH